MDTWTNGIGDAARAQNEMPLYLLASYVPLATPASVFTLAAKSTPIAEPQSANPDEMTCSEPEPMPAVAQFGLPVSRSGVAAPPSAGSSVPRPDLSPYVYQPPVRPSTG